MRRGPAIIAMLAVAAAAAACGGTYPDAGAEAELAGRRGTCGRNGLRHRDERILRDQRYRGGHDGNTRAAACPWAEAAADHAEQRGRSAGGCLRQLLHHKHERAAATGAGHLHGLGVPPSQGAHGRSAGRADQDHDRRDDTSSSRPAARRQAAAPRRSRSIRSAAVPREPLPTSSFPRPRRGGTSTSSPARTSSRCSRTSTTALEPPGMSPARWACSSIPTASPRSSLSTEPAPSARIPSSPDGRRKCA